MVHMFYLHPQSKIRFIKYRRQKTEQLQITQTNGTEAIENIRISKSNLQSNNFLSFSNIYNIVIVTVNGSIIKICE